MMSAMGDADARPSPDRRYMDTIAFGGGDASERLALLDEEHLDAVVLYPTLGLFWECMVTDVELTYAYARAYNRWIADFVRSSGGRLVGVAHVPLLDAERAVEELDRSVADGCAGVFVPRFTHGRVPLGDPVYDRFWSAAQHSGTPVTIHPTNEPAWLLRQQHARFEPWDGSSWGWYRHVLTRQGMEQTLVSLFALGFFERFPEVRIGVLESGASWVASLLDRADALMETHWAADMQVSLAPSEYFRRQCFISADPDEVALAEIVERVGPECFTWASDYPHSDHTGDWAEALERLVGPLADRSRAQVLGDNVRQLYRLGPVAAR
jgi:predicted TIM-barrel fold metal-dependent hydrolase